MKRLNWIVVFALFIAMPALAQEGNIRVKNEVFREVEVKKEGGGVAHRLVEAGKVVPGDEVVYITTFENVGDEPATNITITNPISGRLTYKPGSASGSGTEISFSVDGGESYGRPGELTVENDAGEPVTAEPGDYTHIRWIYTRPLQPGQTSEVMFRAVLE